MKIKELIELLESCPEDTVVWGSSPDNRDIYEIDAHMLCEKTTLINQPGDTTRRNVLILQKEQEKPNIAYVVVDKNGNIKSTFSSHDKAMSFIRSEWNTEENRHSYNIMKQVIL